jgi:hypothetical protein
MRCWSDKESGSGRPNFFQRGCVALGLVEFVPLLALAACSGGDGAGPEGPAPAMFMPGSPIPTTLPPADPAPGVSNYDRPLGMPIGQAAPAGEDEPGNVPSTPDDDAPVDEDIEIPVFMPMDEPPPCSGCVELNLDVNDINQRGTFVFNGGGGNVTRVVWTIIVPFNSDQLFVQPFVDNNYGTYTDLDANAFAINTPVQLVHQYSGPASTVGLAVGSSGAWTGNMTMSVFVDAVTLEGADPSASRTFDADEGGMVAGANSQNPKIVYHP